MASEILSVPEEHLEGVVYVIRRGLEATKRNAHPNVAIDRMVIEQLTKWCEEEEDYLRRLRSTR